MAVKVESLKEIEAVIKAEEEGIEGAVELANPVEEIAEAPIHQNVIDMTTIKTGEEYKAISQAVKDEFNPNATQNALDDDDVEGGVYVARSSSAGLASSVQGGQFDGKTAEIGESEVILSGFNASVNGTSFEVMAKFDNIETAKASVNGDKFIYFENGKMTVANIDSGAPVISNDEIEIAKLVNGKWQRA